MGRGRPAGYVVTHAATRVHGETFNWHTRVQITTALIRCTCGRPFRALTLDEALALYDAHLDRMADLGRPVRRG